MIQERLWQQYVLRRNTEEVEHLWRQLFHSRERHVLYIAGLGFDPRTVCGPEIFFRIPGVEKTNVELWLIETGDYELPEDLRRRTVENERQLRELFSNAQIVLHKIESRDIDGILRTSHSADELLDNNRPIEEYSDIVLDVSSIPRVVYLTLLVGLLGRLVKNKEEGPSSLNVGTTIHVVVAEDASLDSMILSEEIDNEVNYIKGFSGGLGVEVNSEWPVVWFPLLGEQRDTQLRRTHEYIGESDICPVVPHPTRNPRRGDNILLEYSDVLFEEFKVDPNSIMYVDERNPFEAYRQIRDAMVRYSESLRALGGCKLLVTPLSSKLITIGAGLACFEMHDNQPASNKMIGIPYPEPHRYLVEDTSTMDASNAVVTVLVITGEAYGQ